MSPPLSPPIVSTAPGSSQSPDRSPNPDGKVRPRVVSLLPSATELLCSIAGGESLLVGRSHECDHPRTIGTLPVLTAAKTAYTSAAQVDQDVRQTLADGQSVAVGEGTAPSPLYTLDTDRLVALRPDVILTQDLCHVCSIDLAAVRRVASGMSPRPTVLSLNPQTVEGVLDDLLLVGEAVGLSAEAERAAVGLRGRLYAAAEYVNPYTEGPNVAFLEWPDPLFIGGHWTPQLIERAGGRHPLNPTKVTAEGGAGAGPIGETMRQAGKSIVVSPGALVASQPDVVVVCPCGLNLDQTRSEVDRLAATPWWRELPAVRNGRVALVDGNQMFNRPGPRLVDAFEWLVGYLNDRPDVMPREFPWERWE